MLACCILITLEKNESGKGSLRINKGKEVLTVVLLCLYSSNGVWPVSSILFCTIFDWMKGVWMVDQALTSSRCQNAARAEKAEYKLLELRLKKHNTIIVDLVP